MDKIVYVGVESDAYVCGHNEDGEVMSERFYVVVEFEGGQMYAHGHAFPGARTEYTDEGEAYYPDCRQDAEVRATNLAATVLRHVEAGKDLNMECWHFRRTRYGSDAYVDEVMTMTKEERAQ
jgi:hypothetical protein